MKVLPGDHAPKLRYDTAPARRARLQELVRDGGFRTAAELSEQLGVSEMTVRRDVRRLVAQGLLRSVHGGVSVVSEPSLNADFRLRAEQNSARKKAIARRAVEMIGADSVIAIDAGTTALEIARLIPASLRVSAVTHSLPVVNVLASRPHVELIDLGGVLHADTQSFAGPATLAALQYLRVHTLFLGAGAVRNGVMYSTNHYDAVTKRALMEVADEVVLVVDSSKLSRTAMVQVAKLDVVDMIVTDDGIDEDAGDALRRIGPQVVIVPVGTGANDVPVGQKVEA